MVEGMYPSIQAAEPGDGEQARPPRDLGNLAIGGTIGGLVAAKALRNGVIGAGARSIAPAAAGYLVKRLRQARNDAETAVPPRAENSESGEPQLEMSDIPAEQPSRVEPEPEADSEVETEADGATLEESSALPESLDESAGAEADPPCEDSPPMASERMGELEPEPTPTREDRAALDSRDVEAEALEAESELEEALFLMAETGAISSAEESEDVDPGGDSLLPDEEADAGSEGKPSAVVPVRSPFLRDHSEAPIPVPPEQDQPSEAGPEPEPEPVSSPQSAETPSMPESRVSQATSTDLPGRPLTGSQYPKRHLLRYWIPPPQSEASPLWLRQKILEL